MGNLNCAHSLFIDACHLLFDCKELELRHQGLSMLEKAADQGDRPALCLLGDFYLYGKKELVAKNIEKSTACYIRAWNLIEALFTEDNSDLINWNEAADVCLRMGTVFLYGRCQIEDYELAEMFFQNAGYGFNVLLKSGDTNAEKKLEKARNLMLDARARRVRLTEPIHIYDKATLKAKKFTDYPFRAVHRGILDVYDARLNEFLCKREAVNYTGDNESFFYCYADENEGLTLYALGFYNRGAKIKYQVVSETNPIVFRYSSFKNWKVSLGTIAPVVYRTHSKQCLQIMQKYETNQTIMRSCLDDLRSTEFPYDVRAFLTRPSQATEVVWYRPIEIYRFAMKGILLNEPNSTFGLHRGNMIYAELAFQDGELIAIIHGFPSNR